MSRIYFSHFSVADYMSHLPHLETFLALEEQERARRFLRRQDRVQFVIGRVAVRWICANTFGMSPSEIEIALSRFGKPYVASPNDRFEFNISHAHGIVIIVWSTFHPVGVDIEATDKCVLVNQISQIAFSKSECLVLSATTPDRLQQTFFRIWVRKEAVLKAEGRGIADDLRDFSTAYRRNSQNVWPTLLRLPLTRRAWKIVELRPAPKHVAALAVPRFADIVFRSPHEIGLL